MGGGADGLVTLGTIRGVHGVRGWIRVLSFTEPPEGIASYPTWRLAGDSGQVLETCSVEAARTSGRQVLVKLRGIDDRDRAAALIGRDIRVAREALPPCAPGEYYWTDLEGLCVVNLRGEPLGEISHLISTGAHDVLVLTGDPGRMIPFVTPAVVQRVDLAARVVTVDWETSYWD